MMAGRYADLLTRLLKWRYKNVSSKRFIYVMSIAVCLLAGLASVTLKNLTYFIEASLEKGIIFSNNQLYFIIPIIGLTL
ncbi:MAG: chloride channel protein, partial [Eudoraea sp.]|nr:chloride channel protein [Eudoraea sp.]